MKVKKQNKIIIYLLLLAILSIINLYKAKYLNTLYSSYYIKQAIWFIIGFIILLFLKKQNLKFIFKYSTPIYILLNILLLYLLLFGKSINGTKAWLILGPISIQPSEFMKVILPLVLINTNNKKIKVYIKLLKNLIYTLIPSLLVFFEPDTGAVIFYLLIFMVSLFMLKLKPKVYILLFLSCIIILISFILLYIYQKDLLIKVFGTSLFYRIERLIDFKNGTYQLDLALLSIFSSSLFHFDLNNITVYIPEGSTDFIFAFLIGNFGLISGIILVILYFLLALEIIKLITNLNNKKTNYFIISFLIMFIFQFTVNIFMNVGLLPIIGITLPFLSYGGSSLLVYFIFIGIILSLTNKDA